MCDGSLGRLGFLPGGLGASPVSVQDPLDFHGRVEDVQPVFQRRGGGGVATGLGNFLYSRCDRFGGAGDDELQTLEGFQLVRPDLGLVVGWVVAEDGGHTRRLPRGFEPGSHTPGRGPSAPGRLAGPRVGPSAPGYLFRGQEHVEQVFDLAQAGSHGECGDRQLTLFGLAEKDPGLGEFPLGDLTCSPIIGPPEMGVPRVD